MKEVMTALLEAKKQMGKVAKNAKNPHFKNTYADINALIEAVEPILLENGLVLLQPINEGKVTTRIIHAESGQELSSSMELPQSGTPQQMGSAITYYRRYTLQSLLSLQAEDDDANTASKIPVNPVVKQEPKKKADFKGDGYERAIKAVFAGTMTADKIIAAYNVTEEQIKQLNEAQNTVK